MTFVTGDKFKEWKGDLIVCSNKFMYLQHLVIRGSKVVSREIIFKPVDRVRDVRQGWDGDIYVVLKTQER